MRIGLASTEFIKQGQEPRTLLDRLLPTTEPETFIGGGTLHYRFVLPARALEAAGHEVVIGTLFKIRDTGELAIQPWDGFGFMHDDEEHKLLATGCDVIVLQRYMNAGLADDVREARANGQVVLSDVDDWFEGLPRSNRAYWTTHPDPITRAEGKLRMDLGRKVTPQEVSRHLSRCDECALTAEVNREHFRDVTLSCDAVICSTAFLRDRYAERGMEALLWRNSIDIERWDPLPVCDTTAPTIGWYGALGFRAAGDFEIMRSVAGEWLRRTPGAEFVHGGATSNPLDRKAFLSLLGLRPFEARVRREPGRPIAELPGLLRDMRVDVGLVPLEDCDFNHAKSALKLTEMGAAGIPAVASPSPENRFFAAALLASSRAQWLDHLDRLRDPGYRTERALLARIRAEQLSIERTGPEYVSFIEEMAARRKLASVDGLAGRL